MHVSQIWHKKYRQQITNPKDYNWTIYRKSELKSETVTGKNYGQKKSSDYSEEKTAAAKPKEIVKNKSNCNKYTYKLKQI